MQERENEIRDQRNVKITRTQVMVRPKAEENKNSDTNDRN